jgi:HPt (histidine-containing phosphotransfer) domain-containing protein
LPQVRASTDHGPVATPHEVGPSLDLERLAVLTEVCAASGSPATIGVVIDAFLEDGHLRMVEMKGSLRRRDLGALAHLAHELTGSSGTIGAVALADAAAGLHRQAIAAASRSPGEAPDVQRLRRCLEHTEAEFRRAESGLRTAVPGRR